MLDSSSHTPATLFLALIQIAFGSFYLLRLRKRRWQVKYSDAIVVLLFLFVTVGLPVAAYARHTRQVHNAAQAVQQVGGAFIDLGVSYEVELHDPRIGDDELLAIQPFLEPLSQVYIDATGSRITKSGMDQLRSVLPHIHISTSVKVVVPGP